MYRRILFARSLLSECPRERNLAADNGDKLTELRALLEQQRKLDPR